LIYCKTGIFRGFLYFVVLPLFHFEVFCSRGSTVVKKIGILLFKNPEWTLGYAWSALMVGRSCPFLFFRLQVLVFKNDLYFHLVFCDSRFSRYSFSVDERLTAKIRSPRKKSVSQHLKQESCVVIFYLSKKWD